MNLRPSGYEPDELPGCSTPRSAVGERRPAVGRPGIAGKRVVTRARGRDRNRARRWRARGIENCWPGLATTRSPTVRTAVPWARRGFTAEFGMGSGGTPAL